jgi:hypothetical protein
MGDDMDKSTAITEQNQVKFISRKSPNYRLEFINGALSNITPRGEIICDFHLEFKDMPTEQVATIIGDGKATLLPFEGANTFTRDIKFGIVMNSQFAKDLVRLLNDKIRESEGKVQAKSKKDEQA